MSVNDFMTSHIQECSDIIHKEIKDKTFDSHEFIQHFAKKFEAEYSGFLSQYKKDPEQKVNAQIGRFLKKHRADLRIESIGRIRTLNVHGRKTGNELWQK